jgi:GDP-fucose transporter C1
LEKYELVPGLFTNMKSHWLLRLKILGSVLFYTVTAIAAVIANKYFLRAVNVPITLLFSQLVVCSVLLCTGFGVSTLFKKEKQTAKHISQKQVLRALGPMIILNAFGLAFNIVCLHKIDSIMHQVTRGMTLPLTALLGPLFKNDSGSWRVLSLCLIIFSGFIVAVSGELKQAKFSVFGLGAGVVASLINALNAQIIKRSFVNDQFSAIDLVFYNNIYSMLAVLPLALAYEGVKVFQTSDWKTFVFAAAITGVLGFLINYAGFLQIQVTSPVTHCVSCGSRGVLQVIASCLLLHEKVSFTRGLGLCISLFASSIYPVIKSIDNKRSKKAANLLNYSQVKSPIMSNEISVNQSEK